MEKKLFGGQRMNIARNIMLMGCTRFASNKNWVERHTSAKEIANKLLSSRLTGIPVIDNKDNRKVIGIITEMNLLGIFREGMDINNFTAGRIMSGVPKTADIDATAEELIDIMVEHNFTTIPITKNDRLVGIVDRCSMMDFFMTPSMEKYAVGT
jgi:CBS domain-containing protein